MFTIRCGHNQLRGDRSTRPSAPRVCSFLSHTLVSWFLATLGRERILKVERCCGLFCTQGSHAPKRPSALKKRRGLNPVSHSDLVVQLAPTKEPAANTKDKELFMQFDWISSYTSQHDLKLGVLQRLTAAGVGVAKASSLEGLPTSLTIFGKLQLARCKAPSPDPKST